MRRIILILATVCIVISASAFAQRRGGGGGMRGGQSNPNMTSGQRGPGGMAGQGAQMQTREQQRQRIHATDQQRMQMQDCTRSMQQVRSRIRQMSQLSNEPLTREQAAQWREQLRTEMQAMNQKHEALTAGLTQEQKDAMQSRIRDMQQQREKLDSLSDALAMELEVEKPDAATIRDKAREVDSAALNMERQQKQFANELGIEER